MTLDEIRLLQTLYGILSGDYTRLIGKLIRKYEATSNTNDLLKQEYGKMHAALQDIAMTPLLYENEVELFDILCDIRKTAGKSLESVEVDAE